MQLGQNDGPGFAGGAILLPAHHIQKRLLVQLPWQQQIHQIHCATILHEQLQNKPNTWYVDAHEHLARTRSICYASMRESACQGTDRNFWAPLRKRISK